MMSDRSSWNDSGSTLSLTLSLTKPGKRAPKWWVIAWATSLALAALAPPAALAQSPAAEPLVDWKWFQPILAPEEDSEGIEDAESPWTDFLIPPGVFAEAAVELDDLRIYTASGEEVPYALRVRRERSSTEEVPAEVFNRSLTPDGARELSLELNAASIEHNEVEVGMPGNDFRRRATLEGSPDGETWRMLAEDNLIRFARGNERIEDVRLRHPPGRFRYLRLRVYPDPAVDDEPVEIGQVTVRRRIAVAGEDLELVADFGPREATREAGAPASAWMIPLGGQQVPVDRIEIQTPEQDFVRDYVIQYAGPPGPRVRFRQIGAGTWRRREGESPQPLTAEFSEVRAARLRLIVIDHSNPPLRVDEIHFAAPARQVVLPRSEQNESELRLYYGNPEATAPRYDFARNLPDRLEPAPVRTGLGPRQDNPNYVPPPVPVTERWAGMIYVVLTAVSLVLAAVIFSVGRTTIALHDGGTEEPSDASNGSAGGAQS